jgi:hypothetical protein
MRTLLASEGTIVDAVAEAGTIGAEAFGATATLAASGAADATRTIKENPNDRPKNKARFSLILLFPHTND